MQALPIKAVDVECPISKLEQLEKWVHADLQPDLTLLFDIPIEIARQRLSNNVSLDRFEQEQGIFFEKVRQAYLARSQKTPLRFAVIHAEKTREEVQASLQRIVSSL
jgi:dTMP kinase